MQFQPSSETFLLVHGHVAGISHAWVTLDNGKVTYDPTAHAFVNSREYPGKPDCKYTKAQAMKLAASSGHCGPWT
jgi:hypothetical protein